jgi:FtsZ-binding cell division protein ZapB
MTESNSLFRPSNPYDTLRTLEEWVSASASHTGQSNQDRLVRDIRKPPPLSAAQRAQLADSGSTRASRSSQSNLGKRIVGQMIYGLITVILLGLAWQTYEDIETRKLIKASLSAFASSFGTAEPQTKLPATAVTQPVNQPQSPVAISVGVDDVNELKRQVSSVVDDIATLRRDVEQLSTRHEQLSQEVATVQASQQNLSVKVSAPPQINASSQINASPPQITASAPQITSPPPQSTTSLPQAPSESPRKAPAARRQTRKNTPTVVNANTSKRSVMPSPATETRAIGTASLKEPESAPRPPEPVPTATETPPPPR